MFGLRSPPATRRREVAPVGALLPGRLRVLHRVPVVIRHRLKGALVDALGLPGGVPLVALLDLAVELLDRLHDRRLTVHDEAGRVEGARRQVRGAVTLPRSVGVLALLELLLHRRDRNADALVEDHGLVEGVAEVVDDHLGDVLDVELLLVDAVDDGVGLVGHQLEGGTRELGCRLGEAVGVRHRGPSVGFF